MGASGTGRYVDQAFTSVSDYAAANWRSSAWFEAFDAFHAAVDNLSAGPKISRGVLLIIWRLYQLLLNWPNLSLRHRREVQFAYSTVNRVLDLDDRSLTL